MINSLFYYILNFNSNKVYIRYKISHNINIKASTAAKPPPPPPPTTTTTTSAAFVVFGNVLEASLTNCVDQTVPDVGESDLGPHDLPVCLYADVVLCVFYIRRSRNFRQWGGGREVRGSRQKKAPLPGKKLWQVICLFLVLMTNF